MECYYTDEKNIQLLIVLMKAHGVKKIIASPGTVNISFIGSVQQDSYFEVYSAVDERSAAYIACGLAAESGEAVALSCTGATSSRNYMPGLTEAYYRKLPILAITSTLHRSRIGQNIPQELDRSSVPNDIVKKSVYIPTIHTTEDCWECEWKLNSALLELKRHGGGPVHIDLETSASTNFSVRSLPDERVIRRHFGSSEHPVLNGKRIGIFVGAHKKWDVELTELVDKFCERYNAVVFCDHTSNYNGKYGVLTPLVTQQDGYASRCQTPDIMIHIGDVSGAYTNLYPKEVWRINPDGEIRDTFKKLRHVFEMEEIDFFRTYVENAREKVELTYYQEWKQQYDKFRKSIPELPFSNPWIAMNTIEKLPQNSVLYLGILNTLRSWNFFECSNTIVKYANTGGFGIDGGISTILGMSLADKNRLCFGVVGDLSFFYDMNAMGNRSILPNLRIMVINNGKGTEFRNYSHRASIFGEFADDYIAAAGHFGNKSTELLKHYAQDLGFEYFCASNQEEYLEHLPRFLINYITEKPMVFEVFTDSTDESDALKLIRQIYSNVYAKQIVSNLLDKAKRVGIYAVSNAGKAFLQQCEAIDTQKNANIFVFDGDSKKWGRNVGKYEIMSPEKILSCNLDTLVIASPLHYEEIYKEVKYLEKNGVEIIGIENE